MRAGGGGGQSAAFVHPIGWPTTVFCATSTVPHENLTDFLSTYAIAALLVFRLFVFIFVEQSSTIGGAEGRSLLDALPYLRPSAEIVFIWGNFETLAVAPVVSAWLWIRNAVLKPFSREHLTALSLILHTTPFLLYSSVESRKEGYYIALGIGVFYTTILCVRGKSPYGSRVSALIAGVLSYIVTALL